MSGPFPNIQDGTRALDKLQRERLYMEQHLSAEKDFVFSHSAEQFCDGNGVCTDLLTPYGLSTKGVEVLTADLLNAIQSHFANK